MDVSRGGVNPAYKPLRRRRQAVRPRAAPALRLLAAIVCYRCGLPPRLENTLRKMTTQTQSAKLRRKDALGVHSLNRFAFSVPDIAAAERFYSAFGLDVRRDGDRIELRTHGNDH